MNIYAFCKYITVFAGKINEFEWSEIKY